MSDDIKHASMAIAQGHEQGIESSSGNVTSTGHESHLAQQIMHRYRMGATAQSTVGANTLNRCIRRKLDGDQSLLNRLSRYQISQQGPLTRALALPVTTAVNRPIPNTGLPKTHSGSTDSVRIQTKIAPCSVIGTQQDRISTQAYKSSGQSRRTLNTLSEPDSTVVHTLPYRSGYDTTTLRTKSSVANPSVQRHSDVIAGTLTMSDDIKHASMAIAQGHEQGIESSSGNVTSTGHESHLAQQIMHRYRMGATAQSTVGANTLNRCIRRKLDGDQSLLNRLSRYQISQQGPLTRALALPVTTAVNRPIPNTGLPKTHSGSTDSVRIQTKIAPCSVIGTQQDRISTQAYKSSGQSRRTLNTLSEPDSTVVHTLPYRSGYDTTTLRTKSSVANPSVQRHNDVIAGALSNTQAVSGPVVQPLIARTPGYEASQAVPIDVHQSGNAFPKPGADAVSMKENNHISIGVAQPGTSVRENTITTMVSRQVIQAATDTHRPLFRSVSSVSRAAPKHGSVIRDTSLSTIRENVPAQSVNRKNALSRNDPSLQYFPTQITPPAGDTINHSPASTSYSTMLRQVDTAMPVTRLVRQVDGENHKGSMTYASAMPHLRDSSAIPQVSTKLQPKGQGGMSQVSGLHSVSFVQTQTDTSMGQDSRGATPMPEYSMSNTSDYANPISEIELVRVAEQVYEMLEQRLTIERESLGL